MKSDIEQAVEQIADRKAGEYFAAEFERGGRQRLLQKFASEAILADLQAWMLKMMNADCQPDTIQMSGDMYRLFSLKYAKGGKVGRAHYSQLRQYQRQARLAMYAPYGVPYTYAKETMLDNMTRPIRRWWKKITTPARTIYVDFETRADGLSYATSSPTGRNTAARIQDMMRPYQRETLRRVMETPPSILNLNMADLESRVMAYELDTFREVDRVTMTGAASWGKTEDAFRQLNQALSSGVVSARELRRSLRRVWPTTEHWGSRRRIDFAWPVVWMHNVVREKDGTRYVFRNLMIACWHIEWNSHFMGDI